MKFKGIRMEKTQDGKLLLFAGFQDQPEWMPRWASIRQLFQAGAYVEVINSGGLPNKELQEFAEVAEFVLRLTKLTTTAGLQE